MFRTLGGAGGRLYSQPLAYASLNSPSRNSPAPGLVVVVVLVVARSDAEIVVPAEIDVVVR
jgi:hypothetical protein